MTWLRRILVLFLLLAIAGSTIWVWVLHTQAGARWVWAQVVEVSGIALSAEDIGGALGSGATISGVVIETEDSAVRLDAVHLRVDVDVLPPQVEISEIEVSVAGASMDGDLIVGLTGSNTIELVARARAEPSLTGLDDVVQANVVADGDLDRLDLEVTTERPSASLTGSVSQLLEEPRWDLTLVLASLESLRVPEMTLRDVQATTRGGLSAYDVIASGSLEHPATGEIRLSVEGSGDLGSFDARSLVARSDVGRGDGRISVRWSDQLSAEGDLGIVGLDLNRWIAQWPAANTLSGDVAFEIDPDRLDVEGGRLDVRGTDMRVDVDAAIDLNAATVSGELGWQGLQLPVGDPIPQVFSRNGRVELAGALDSWTVRGDIDVGTPHVPRGSFSIDGGGDRDSIEVRIVDAELLGGSLAGEARYRWRDSRPWSASLALDDIEIGAVEERWPAVLDGRIELVGQREPFAVSAILTDVRGQLEGEVVAGDGQFAISDGELSAQALSVQHGGSRIELDGSLYDGGVDYALAVDELGRYIDGSSGAVTASGSVSLDDAGPFLRIDATSEALEYEDLTVTDLSIADGGATGSMLDVVISAGNVAYSDADIDDLQMQAFISDEIQRFSLAASKDDLKANLALSGELDDWAAPSGWQGQVDALELSYGDVSASMPAPAAIQASPSGATLERLCLREEALIDVCAALSWAEDDQLTLDAELGSLPAGVVNLFMDTRLAFDQVISGHLHWELSAEAARGETELSMSPGTIASVDRPEMTISTDTGVLRFAIDDDDLRSGVVRLPMPGFGDISADFGVVDVTGGEDSDVHGRINVDVSDIALFAAFIPVVDEARGGLRAILSLAGSIVEPSVQGDVRVDDGSLIYLPLGLRLDEIGLSMLIHSMDRFEVIGSFLAGDGRATIETRGDSSRTGTAGVQVRLHGNGLTLIDVPDIRAVADTDITVGFDRDTLHLDGSIIVQEALVTPSTRSFSRVSESEDVIIVAGELPDDAVEEVADSTLRITGALGIAFGRDVVIDLGVTRTNLVGSALFTWSGDPIPMAVGRYDLDGEIQAFGQNLEIVSGGLRFPNVPADDPQFRLRAIRQIYGNSQIKEAGVLVSGSIRRPTIEAYTNPLTTEQRALTLLLTGSEFDYEQGVGAVNFGTYIAPRVYASYGVGLFERENVIRIRYDLARGFGITATSGTRDSGLELSYRFEN